MLLVEQNLNVLSKATAVVIPDCLGVSKGLGERQKGLSVNLSVCNFCLIFL